MDRAIHDYPKSILRKVSFDPNLFYFEVQKAIQRLIPYEREELKDYISQIININHELGYCSFF